ncbi:FAD-binding oxidoreductase [Georgenia subflava]|uniref:FAD-binding protein n=1 Tax=Georgenia subflava TaxID=1622177 RepID=A0A6N7EFB8_9MICO|nr:FAD-binding oxidoreductase [Georgenia subflava]MPV35883.1 FAD-binding protein [Georgenia subflava]
MHVKTDQKTDELLDRLRREVAGTVLGPEDDGYDMARTTKFGDPEARPATIVRATGAADVASAISAARETGLELAVRSGGHSGAGFGTTDGGIVLDLHEMKALEIDVAGRAAWAEPGLTAREYVEATGRHGLTTGFGDTGSVGLGGLTLGGGLGLLARKHGLTIDSLLAAEIVTADGDLLLVDDEHHRDLFWAIRGGGGNFGVVTRFRLRLHEVDEVVGGLLVLPATAEVVERFVALAQDAPEELTTIASVMACPPMPFLPAEVHGRLVVLAMMVHTGPVEAAEKAVAPFRTLTEPLADLVRPLRYPEMYGEDPPSGGGAVFRTSFVDDVDHAAASAIMERLEAPGGGRVVQLRALGGAVARVPADATAYAHRSSRVLVSLGAFYADPADRAGQQAWVDGAAAVLHRPDGPATVNFLGREGSARVRAAYPDATWDRLLAVKRRYDPDNLFRLNQNVWPDPA